MAVARLCVILTVLVSAKMILAQPIFGTRMWCDTFCDDDDDDDYDSSAGFEDFLDSLFDPCTGCSSRPTRRRTTTVPPAMKQPFNIMIPPASGLNLTLSNNGGSWLMDFIPWMAKPAATKPTAAAATTAKPTTAAATTAAGGATTAAPTTKAKA